jgi:hypothetical protein
LVIIQFFQKNKKFKNIFKHFINRTKSGLLCKLKSINKVIHIINKNLLSKEIEKATGNNKKQSCYNYKTLKSIKNCRVAIISKLINKYKKLKIISTKKIRKIDILIYIYKKLQIISKKKLTIINKLKNKHKKEKILINREIKNKHGNRKVLKNKIIKNKAINKHRNKETTQSKIKKTSNIKCKRLVLILKSQLKKKLIQLNVIDISKIFRIIKRFPRYSYKIYNNKKRPKKSIRRIKLSSLFRI